MVFMCRLCGVEPAVYTVGGKVAAGPNLCENCYARLHPRPPPPPAEPPPPPKPCHVDWWSTAPASWRRGLVFLLRSNGATMREIADLVGLSDAGVRRYDDIVMCRARHLADRRFPVRRHLGAIAIAARTGHLDWVGRGL
jgi:hypothetical protein